MLTVLFKEDCLLPSLQTRNSRHRLPLLKQSKIDNHVYKDVLSDDSESYCIRREGEDCTLLTTMSPMTTDPVVFDVVTRIAELKEGLNPDSPTREHPAQFKNVRALIELFESVCLQDNRRLSTS